MLQSSRSPNLPGNLVKSINISTHPLYRNWILAPSITELANYCPYVEVLRISSPSNEVWNNLEQARLEGQWQLVRSIPDLRYGQEIEAYVQTMLAYRNTLEKVFLCGTYGIHNDVTRDVYVSQYRIIIDHLTQFRRLKCLLLYSYTNKSIFEIDDFIDNCHILEEIIFNPIRLDEESQAIAGGRDEGEITNFSAVKQLFTVKKYSGDKMMMTDRSIQYLMHKFPELNELMLNTGSYGAVTFCFFKHLNYLTRVCLLFSSIFQGYLTMKSMGHS